MIGGGKQHKMGANSPREDGGFRESDSLLLEKISDVFEKVGIPRERLEILLYDIYEYFTREVVLLKESRLAGLLAFESPEVFTDIKDSDESGGAVRLAGLYLVNMGILGFRYNNKGGGVVVCYTEGERLKGLVGQYSDLGGKGV